MTAYSDFPPSADVANYMHNTQVLNYLRAYAKRFDLVKHIRFGHEVKLIARANDFDKSGQWIVRYCNLQSVIGLIWLSIW